MPFLNVVPDSQSEIQLFYQDIGSGHPVILVGGWPFPHNMWDYQLHYLSGHGYRCITYDRRGFGRSDRPAAGYDYNTLAGDLHTLITHLKLEHFTLAGFSMGGGEVVRYCTNYGQDKVKNIVLIGSIIPYMLQTEDNPEGVPREVFDNMKNGILKDRPDFLTGFTKTFFGVGLLDHPVSNASLEVARSQCADSSITANLECLESFATTDFRKELQNVTVPVLIIHGTADKNVPIEPSSYQAVKILSNATLVEYENEPHGLNLTQTDRLNHDLSGFCMNSTFPPKNPS